MWLSSKIGVTEETIELFEEATIRKLLEYLCNQKPSAANMYRKILEGSSEIIVLHNSKTPSKGLETPLKDGDTVILIPPVSGG